MGEFITSFQTNNSLNTPTFEPAFDVDFSTQRKFSNVEKTFTVLARVVLVLILICTLTISLTGNTVAFIIVHRKTTMRSAINMLVANLALSDILLSLSTIPLLLFILICNAIEVNAVICNGFSIILNLLICVIVYSLLVISTDRFLIIVHRKDTLNPKMAKHILYAIWVFSILFSLLRITTSIIYGFQTEMRICNSSFKVAVVKIPCSVIYVCLSFFFPVLIMFYMYVVILRTVHQNSKRVHNFPGSTMSISVTQYSSKLGFPIMAKPHRLKEYSKRRAFGTIILLYIVLISCWSPYLIYLAVVVIKHTGEEDDRTNIILLCAGLLKTALFPVVYYARNKKFRDACCSILRISLKCSKSRRKFKLRRVKPSSVYECSIMTNRN